MAHEYEGGEIESLEGSVIGDHYHVDYMLGEGDDPQYEWGYVVDVYDKGFAVMDDDTILLSCSSLKEAVEFCFKKYQAAHPEQLISPVWGAGAPNKTLEELGYTSTWPPRKQ